ncbi:cytosolic Fe-S cluster assembly factor NUBP2-like isoform X2 [Varroa destructor]|uniref:Cytosolic Fe-S cluster assembly factor NUBP2 homolog n=1 Tax=Varroa destructor TaxID=109461 RepID=A0A7M7K0E3_VARDE|nr:cytosolic Fe-S cluster assembly factor NUBP2-like isoform X2 [Varroa destructor]
MSEADLVESLGGCSKIRSVVLVLSGKGGVGKSTTCVQLALSLARTGKQVGVLDVDLCGPSVPRMLGVKGAEVMYGEKGWLPVETRNIKVMSIGFLLKNEDDAVVWRGPKKHAMIGQFLSDVEWGALDILLVDTPPGTSDEHMSLVEALQAKKFQVGAILVTTPQNVAVSDVRREATFSAQAGLRTVGVVENMSGFVCPHCTECSLLFSQGGGEKLAEIAKVAYLSSRRSVLTAMLARVSWMRAKGPKAPERLRISQTRWPTHLTSRSRNGKRSP